MTEKRIEKSIMPCIIAAVIACLLFAASGVLFIRASADDEPGVVIVDEEPESTQATETESQAPSTTGPTGRTPTERTSWTNKYRTTTSTTSASSSSAPSESRTSDTDSTTKDRTSRRPVETTRPITGVPNDFNRTTYRGGNTARPSDETFTTAPEDTTSEDIETATVSEPAETDFYMGETDYSASSSDESSSSALTPEEIAQKEHRAALMRKIAIALGAAAIVLILSGLGFVLWYKKENELKEEQKNLVRFEEDNKEE